MRLGGHDRRVEGGLRGRRLAARRKGAAAAGVGQGVLPAAGGAAFDEVGLLENRRGGGQRARRAAEALLREHPVNPEPFGQRARLGPNTARILTKNKN